MNKKVIGRVQMSLIQYKLTKPRQKQINIESKKIDKFLQYFWDEIEILYGYISYQHKILNVPGNMKAQSNFIIHESTFTIKLESTKVLISFVINKQKGINTVFIAATYENDKTESYKENIDCINKIIKIIDESIIKYEKIRDTYPTAIARIALNSYYPIDGLYYLDDEQSIVMYPISKKENELDRGLYLGNIRSNYSYLDFYVYKTSEKCRTFEAISKAEQIASCLTLLTQNLFYPVTNEKTFFIESPIEDSLERQEYLKTLKLGCFTDDKDMFVKDPNAGKFFVSMEGGSEIIEMRDVIKDQKIRFPQHIQQAISIVLKDNNLLRSACRFQEAIILQHQTYLDRGNMGSKIIPYELLAFVSSIETLLQTKPQKTKSCDSCGETIITQKSQITKKFNNFVDEHIGYNPIISPAFKKLYQDRSKFVHEGRDLYDQHAKIPNRPYRFKGAKIQEVFPGYYANIGDYTGLVIRKYIYRKISAPSVPIWRQRVNFLVGLIKLMFYYADSQFFSDLLETNEQ